jgi:hypothetical protein
MTRHVAVDEFYKNPAKYVDEVGMTRFISAVRL